MLSFIQTHCANCWVIACTPAHHLLPACCRGTVGLPVKPLMGRARVERACKPFFIFSYFIFFIHICIYFIIIDQSGAGMQALLYIFIFIGPKLNHCLALSVIHSSHRYVRWMWQSCYMFFSAFVNQNQGEVWLTFKHYWHFWPEWSKPFSIFSHFTFCIHTS